MLMRRVWGNVRRDQKPETFVFGLIRNISHLSLSLFCSMCRKTTYKQKCQPNTYIYDTTEGKQMTNSTILDLHES